MNVDELTRELEKHIDNKLADDLVSEFISIRHDAMTGTLGRSSIGKFVETVVQIMQLLETGKFEQKPKVDEFLKNIESRKSSLDDDLKIVFSRVGRAVYTLRNKRNIAHKGSVDPNIYDLRYAYASAQWMLSELARQLLKSDMKSVGKLIEFVQVPISSIVEDLGDRKIVFGSLTVEKELLVLLHSYYPEYTSRSTINESLDRRSNSSISKTLSKIWKEKLVHKEASSYKLTQKGHEKAIKVLQGLD